MIPYYDSSRKFQSRWLKSPVTPVAIVAAGSLIWSGGHFIGAVRRAEAVSTRSAGRDAPAQDTAGMTGPDVTRMAWFGVPQEDAPSPPPISEGGGGPVLKGVSLSESPALTGAFISVNGATESYYRPGDILPENAGMLAEVFADHVTLARAGATVPLGFPAAERTEPPPDAAQQPAAPVELLPQLTPDMPLADIVTLFQAEPAMLLKEAGLEAVEADKDMGYRFTGADRHGTFRNTGLQKDDVIIGVNDTPVGDMHNDRLRAADFASARSLKLSVMRDGRPLAIEYRLP